MKRYFFLSVALTLTMMLHAEVTHWLGAQIGFSQSILRSNTPTPPDMLDGAVSTMYKGYNEDKTKLNANSFDGVQLGLVYEADWIKGFGTQFELLYRYSGHVTKWKDYPYDLNGIPTAMTVFDYKTRDEVHQLSLSVLPQYKITIAKETWLIAYTGVSVNALLGYKAQDDVRWHLGQADVTSYVGRVGYTDAEMTKYYSRWNIQWGLGAGFQYRNMYLRGGYNFGLTNPYAKDNYGQMGCTSAKGVTDDRLTRGRWDSWSISFGYYFWQSDK